MSGLIFLCVHGIPGTTADFDYFAQQFAHSQNGAVAKVVTLDLGEEISLPGLIGRFSEKIKKEKPDVVLAYSWGAYLTLKVFESDSNLFEGVSILFVNPTLSAGKAPGFVEGLLASSRYVGNLFFSLLGRRLATSHIQKTLAPGSVAEGLRLELEKGVSGGMTWWLALRRKKLMHQLPIKSLSSSDSSMPNVLGWVVGQEDQSVPPDEQLKLARARGLDLTRVEEVADGGHGLLWTHVTQLVKTIESWTALDLSTNK